MPSPKKKSDFMHEIELFKLRERFYVVLGLFCLICLTTLFRQLSSKSKRLEKALNEIERLNKARDFFLGVIAHDLRRPLSSLHEMAKLADFYIKTQRYEELTKISASIDRSGEKIRNLLDNMINWVVSNEGRYRPEVVNITDKINAVIELYAQTISNRQIRVVYECPTSLTVFADENGFELIIRNLVDNALKYLHPNGRLSIEVTEIPSGNVQVRVGDNGRGMTQEKLTEVKYILTHAETLIPGQIGSSLGMLLIGRFVKINKGIIVVNSQLETGTVFTLILPGYKDDRYTS